MFRKQQKTSVVSDLHSPSSKSPVEVCTSSYNHALAVYFSRSSSNNKVVWDNEGEDPDARLPLSDDQIGE
jgi:hypothetical protein